MTASIELVPVRPTPLHRRAVVGERLRAVALHMGRPVGLARPGVAALLAKSMRVLVLKLAGVLLELRSCRVEVVHRVWLASVFRALLGLHLLLLLEVMHVDLELHLVKHGQMLEHRRLQLLGLAEQLLVVRVGLQAGLHRG